MIERLAGGSITKEESLSAMERERGLIPVVGDGAKKVPASARESHPEVP